MARASAVPAEGRPTQGRSRAFALGAGALACFAWSHAVAADPAPAGASACSGCHAAATAIAASLPPLAGMDEAHLVRAMQEFRNGERVATVMDRIAKGFSDAEVRAIAQWFARQR